MKFSQVAFRITFVVLAIAYLAVITDFVDPQSYNLNLNVKYDALALSAIVVCYIYVFLRRS